MLVAPIIDSTNKELMGVIQIINTKSGTPFSVMIEEGVTHLAETLAIAFRQRGKGQQLVRGKYDALVTNAVISAEELELATRSARRKNLEVETVLLDEFQVKPTALGEALSAFFGVPYEPFKADRVKPLDLLRNLKRDFCESSGWVPVDEDAKEGLIIVTTDPEKIKSSRVVNNVFPKSRIVYKVCSLREFASALDQLFGVETDLGGSIDDMLGGMTDEIEIEDGGSVNDDTVNAANDNELVKLVNKVIMDAYSQGASDIHIEPYPGKQKTEIRFRRDGSLQPYISVPASYRSAIAARLKIMCDLDIAERRRPQDGKIKFKKYGPLDIELRVATIPTQGGVEDIVMRILAAGEPIPLDKLGLSARNIERLKFAIEKPYGLFFVCGPTGSGKTTSLHSVLGYLNTPDTKIWTAEDPVEITQRGLRQVQMNPKAGLTFAVAMKAFLRADPDIIMVGEMRDKETTSTGIEASLTGHLVFATLHTNSAPESIIRLLDMGMDPFNFADALLGVLAQRLAKRLCGKCKKPHVATAEEVQALMEEFATELAHTSSWKDDPQGRRDELLQEWMKNFGNDKGEITLYEAVGCEVCGGTGYKGRVGLHELLLGTDAVKKNIQEHARVAEMIATALEDGMRTLKQDGIEKVLQGITDIKQVRAVCIK
jgi:type II secretory ATPase GspE/PulE/Tfp pilus assembly ATPase PilB-like protein